VDELALPNATTSRLQLGATLISSALVAAAVWRMTGSTSAAWVCLVAGAALGAWALEWGWRVTAITLSLCIVPPGVIGENSAEVATVASLALYLCLATTPVETRRFVRPTWVPPLLLIGESIAVVAGSLLAGFPPVRSSLSLLALYLLAGLSLYELNRRPSLVMKALRSLMWVIALACTSYVISYATGFVGGVVIELQYRNLTFYPPATFTLPSGGFLPGFPRLVVLSGEPGLAAIFILIAIWCAFKFERGRRRALLVGLLASGALFSQSTGLVFALMIFALAAALVEVTRRLTLGVSIVVAFGLIPVMRWLTDVLLAEKRSHDPASLLDRGFNIKGFQADLARGDISLLATLDHFWQVLPLLCLLAFLAFSTIRNPAALGLVLAVASIALYAQPLQWHPGAWLLLSAAVAIATRASIGVNPDSQDGLTRGIDPSSTLDR
jgi:hypothetical protein